MDIFERLRRVTGDVPWGMFAQVMAPNLGQSAAAAHEVVEQLKEWGAHLTKNALLKWTASAVTPTPCDSPDFSNGRPKPCGSYAVLHCDACGRPCCLAHARVDYMGDGVCEICIIDVQRERRPNFGAYARPHAGETSAREKKPGEMTPAEALKALKLPVTATWEQIRKQYKRLAVKYNADRPQTDKQRATNVDRLKKINQAIEVLRAVHQKQEAA